MSETKPKLLILVGPTATGKTTHARELIASGDYVAGHIGADLFRGLKAGKNVVIDSEYLQQFDVEVKHFE